ncbi:unnamed protein product [Paramecium octaurelia]|uniref:Ribosomal RNA small subunit methyltransferase NEP1 n=1 Tax=Paramecium octaurelia TaxID=43137 RepID=A0A8S1TTM3_PAROT|nr:unnamed protein product [Paramecium octaurelia]
MLKQLSNKKQIKKLKKTIQKSLNNEVPIPELEVQEKLNKEIVTFILDGAVLQLGQLKSSKVLLNFEDHSHFITKRLGRNPEDFRPDIVHQSLLTLLDSPLNKAGLMKVLIRTEDNRLIEINPITKIPRTFKRFSGMMAKLLETAKIQSDDQVLLQIHNDTVQEYFSNEAYIVATSHKAKLVDLKEYIQKKHNLVFVIGAVAKGNPGLECKFSNDCISISRYQLSTSNCLSKIIDTFEQYYQVI